MGGLIAKCVFRTGQDDFDVARVQSLNDLPVTTIEGTRIAKLGELVAGKKFYMVVNVASK